MGKLQVSVIICRDSWHFKSPEKGRFIAQSPEHLVQKVIQQVDEGRLRAHVARLATGERHGLHAPERHSQVADYIHSVLEESGLATRRMPYRYGRHSGTNILASNPSGKEPDGRPILVSAHYDTVRGSPGADDNASGVAALLECARALSSAELAGGVEFVCFDQEEKQAGGGALLGSSAFVRAAGGKGAYEGLYNLEMVSYTSGPGSQGYPPGFRFILPGVFKRAREREFRGDFVATVSMGAGVQLGRRYADAASRWVPALEVLPVEVRYRLPILMDMFRSDHAPPFGWRASPPSCLPIRPTFVTLIIILQPIPPETLDYAFLANVTRALVAALVEHAGVEHAGVEHTELD